MDTSAGRMRRVLFGFSLTLVTVVSVALLDEERNWGSEFILGLLVSMVLFSILLIILLSVGGGRPHGKWITDSWMSREYEVDMWNRLDKEREEASMEGLGSSWAKMEMEHLESKHSEE